MFYIPMYNVPSQRKNEIHFDFAFDPRFKPIQFFFMYNRLSVHHLIPD